MPTQYFGHPGATKIQSARSHKISLRICPMCLNCPLTKQNALDPSSLVQGSMKPSTPADPGAEYFEYHLSAFANSFWMNGSSCILLLGTSSPSKILWKCFYFSPRATSSASLVWLSASFTRGSSREHHLTLKRILLFATYVYPIGCPLGRA